MTSGDSYFGGNLTAYVNNGSIPIERVDDMGTPPSSHLQPPLTLVFSLATRILAGYYLLRQDAKDYPPVNFDAFLPDDEEKNLHIDVQENHYELVRKMGAASTVLLKNVNQTLPLKKPRSLVLIGSDAGPGKAGPNQFADHVGSLLNVHPLSSQGPVRLEAMVSCSWDGVRGMF